MENKNILKNFLLSHGFEIIEYSDSNSFGDFYLTYSDGKILIRILSDRSIISINISTAIDNKIWYDLALIKALLLNTDNLVDILETDEAINFIEQNLEYIKLLFTPKKYSSTKVSIENIRRKRVKQMFPWYKNED